MGSNSITVVSLTSLDYERIARLPDRDVIEEFVAVCRVSKKRIVPRKIRYNAYRVSRAQHLVTIHLLNGDKETFRFNFVPAPSFQ
jgi:hypothetical protein